MKREVRLEGRRREEKEMFKNNAIAMGKDLEAKESMQDRVREAIN